MGDSMSEITSFEINTGGFELALSNFNGPLDFLLELVKINKIEIKDIFVSQVTEQFLQYMSQLSALDVDMASEYMATAATLLEIKSKSLLPMIEGDDSEESPEAIFVKQLEEYKMFKEIVVELKEQETINRFYREPDSSVGQEVEIASENLTMDSFIKAFEKFLATAGTRTGVEKVSRAISKETFSIIDRIEYVQSALAEYGKLNFASLFQPTSSKLEVVVTFSAILEMLKSQLISVVQSELFEDFEITTRDSQAELILEDTIDG